MKVHFRNHAGYSVAKFYARDMQALKTLIEARSAEMPNQDAWISKFPLCQQVSRRKICWQRLAENYPRDSRLGKFSTHVYQELGSFYFLGHLLLHDLCKTVQFQHLLAAIRKSNAENGRRDKANIPRKPSAMSLSLGGDVHKQLYNRLQKSSQKDWTFVSRKAMKMSTFGFIPRSVHWPRSICKMRMCMIN